VAKPTRAKPHDIDLNRLCIALQKDRYVLRRFRQERMNAVRLYLGGHWSDEASYEKQPVNLISLYCQIVGRSLIAKDPRVMLSTFDQQNKPIVHAMESWANREIIHMRLANTLQRVVLDALFSVGICKVALATPADASLFSWNLRAGSPFAERVDLDDFVFDVHARDFSEVSYIGHRYRARLEVIRDSPIYNKASKDLTASTDSPYNLEGDEKISALGRMPYAVDSEEYTDWVDLWEIYLPFERMVVTLHDDSLSGASTVGSGLGHVTALREVEWIGPDSGPYHVLGYLAVPGNAMPKGPIQDLIDLHESVNNGYRKLDRQMRRLKEQLLVSAGSMEDAARIQANSDGDVVKCDNPERMKVAMYGGPQPALVQIATHFMDLFMKVGGNLEMLGGLAPQSKTLGQDQLLAQNANGGMADMQQRTIGYTSEILNALCWYFWHHPTLEMKTDFKLPGAPDLSMTRTVTPQQRMQARWSDMGIQVDPFSLAHQTPQQMAQAVTQIVTQLIIPLAPIAQAQGISPDLNALIDKLSKWYNLPDLGEIIRHAAPPQTEAPPAAPDAGAKPAETTRNYVRRSIGGDNQNNREQSIIQGMMPGTNGQRNGQGAGAA
jgi:hypothetical protein